MIGIKGMDLPKSCTICPAYWEMNAFGLEIEKCRILDKDLKYTISALCPIDPQCPLVDLGKEDMSWEELVEKVKGMSNIEFGEISRLKHIKINVTFNPLYYYESRLFCSKNLAFESITPYQMYQIIKSLVGDKR